MSAENKMNNGEIFIIFIKDGSSLTFHDKCNGIDFTNQNICVFNHYFDNGSYETLGMTPYENINYIIKVKKESYDRNYRELRGKENE